MDRNYPMVQHHAISQQLELFEPSARADAALPACPVGRCRIIRMLRLDWAKDLGK